MSGAGIAAFLLIPMYRYAYSNWNEKRGFGVSIVMPIAGPQPVLKWLPRIASGEGRSAAEVHVDSFLVLRACR